MPAREAQRRCEQRRVGAAKCAEQSKHRGAGGNRLLKRRKARRFAVEAEEQLRAGHLAPLKRPVGADRGQAVLPDQLPRHPGVRPEGLAPGVPVGAGLVVLALLFVLVLMGI